MSNRTASFLLGCTTLIGLGASCGSDPGVRLTISPAGSLTAAELSKVTSLDIALTGADTATQSFTKHTDGVGALFSAGAERVTFMPKAAAQGTLVIDVLARRADHKIIAKGHAELQLDEGGDAGVDITISAPPPCENGIKDRDEGDVDCGGASCTNKCATGSDCYKDTDCADGGCVQNQCAPIYCANGRVDSASGETDLDCGGTCPRCMNTAACTGAADCQSGFCATDHRCAPCGESASCAAGQECIEGACTVPGSTTRDCVIDHGKGSQMFSGNAWGPCVPTSCEQTYHVAGPICDSDTHTCTVGGGSGVQTWNGTTYGACVATGCPANQHVEGNACVNDARSCTLANGTGSQSWNGASYGTCAATQCNSGYHVELATCASDTRSCMSGAGTGTQTWNGAAYGTCMVSSCFPNYHLDAGTCVSNVQPCVIGNGQGAQVWNGSAYGACLATSCNAGYHIEGAGCTADTRACAWPNGSGTQSWNPGTMTYSACVYASCNAGYHNDGAGTCVPDRPIIASVSVNNFPNCGCQNEAIAGTYFAPGMILVVTDKAGIARSYPAAYVSPTQVTATYCSTSENSAGQQKWHLVNGALVGDDITVTVVTSAPQIMSLDLAAVQTDTSQWCPKFTMKPTNGLCRSSSWHFYDTPTGGTPNPISGRPVKVADGNPTLVETETTGMFSMGCMDLTNFPTGTYYLDVTPSDGGPASNRIAIQVVPHT